MKISRKLVIGNAVFDAGGLILVQGITFFILPLFIKNLGAELYGVWVISGILTGYLDFFDFGLTAGLQKFIADARAKQDHGAFSETVSSALGFLAIVGCVCGLFIILARGLLVDAFHVSPAHREEAMLLLMVTGLGSFLQWPLRVGPVTMQATLHIKQASVRRTLNGIMSSLVMLGMVVWVSDIVWIRVATLAFQISFQLRMLLMSRRLMPELEIRLSLFRWGRIREMYSFSLAMFVFQLLGMLASQIQPMVLGVMLAPVAVAHYTIATKLYSLVGRFTSTLNQTVLPTAFNLHALGDKHRLYQLVERGVRYRMLAVGPLGVCCLVLSGPFLRLWMGNEYAFLGPYSALLGLTILTGPLAVAIHVARAVGNVPVINRLYALRVVVNVVLLIVGLPWFGAGSAVVGFVVTQVIPGDVSFFPFFCRLMKIPSEGIMIQFSRQFFLALLFAMGGWVLVAFWRIDTWWELGACAGLLLIVHYFSLLKIFVLQAEIYDIRLAMEAVGLGRFTGMFRILGWTVNKAD